MTLRRSARCGRVAGVSNAWPNKNWPGLVGPGQYSGCWSLIWWRRSSRCRRTCSSTPASPPNIWILDNTKRPERQGEVQLIDATSFWTKIRKNLGAKNLEVDAAARDRIVALYDAFDEADPDFSKVFTANDFGYWTSRVYWRSIEDWVSCQQRNDP